MFIEINPLWNVIAQDFHWLHRIHKNLPVDLLRLFHFRSPLRFWDDKNLITLYQRFSINNMWWSCAQRHTYTQKKSFRKSKELFVLFKSTVPRRLTEIFQTKLAYQLFMGISQLWICVCAVVSYTASLENSKKEGKIGLSDPRALYRDDNVWHAHILLEREREESVKCNRLYTPTAASGCTISSLFMPLKISIRKCSEAWLTIELLDGCYRWRKHEDYCDADVGHARNTKCVRI